MVIRLSSPKQENYSNSTGVSNIQSYCELYAKELASRYQSSCVRIVYHHSGSNKHEEVVKYAENLSSFSPQSLAYLRSEIWLKNFPHVFEIHEFMLTEFPEHFFYICPIGYKNQNPEYLQLITKKPLTINLQKSLQESAVILSKYLEIYSECLRQKSEILLLEHILHKAGHQLRNSLSLITLHAHNLYLGLQDGYLQQQAKVVCESVQELDSNLTEILSCSQGVKLNTFPQDIRNIVLESVKLLQPMSQDKKLVFNIPDAGITVMLDKLQIQQVFENLISNAIHFSPDFGTITFNWHIFKEEVIIQITDQGLGILPEDMQKIFNPFYSRRPGGTGLGLTIAKKIVLDHHGRLWAQNLPQGGARFSIILPRK